MDIRKLTPTPYEHISWFEPSNSSVDPGLDLDPESRAKTSLLLTNSLIFAVVLLLTERRAFVCFAVIFATPFKMQEHRDKNIRTCNV